MKICPRCGSRYSDSESFCTQCGSQLNYCQTTPPPYGAAQTPGSGYDTNNAFDATGPQGKSRGVAALLAILLGGLGVHYFYLNKIGGGFICLALTLITCGIWEIITLIQGILMFCMSNQEFQRKYVDSTSAFPIF